MKHPQFQIPNVVLEVCLVQGYLTSKSTVKSAICQTSIIIAKSCEVKKMLKK